MFCSTKVGIFTSNPGKLHFEGLVHLLRYIRDNKNFVLRPNSNIEDAPIYDILINAIINTNN